MKRSNRVSNHGGPVFLRAGHRWPLREILEVAIDPIAGRAQPRGGAVSAALSLNLASPTRLAMQVQIGNTVLELVQGDITQQQVDAIVNAANSRLAGGGGVDGAIHRRGGPAIMADTQKRYPGGCPTGSAVVSVAGNLPARIVIHAVGPVWHGGEQQEAELLASAYRTALERAVEHGCRSIAFPALSTGAYGYPLDLASRTALAAVIEFLKPGQPLDLVRFVLFSEGALGALAAALEELVPPAK
jgi:O-acetyl-ADP-ribose deacetylase (regulator of RNase III)